MKASNNSILDGASGKLGRKLVVRESFGESIISNRPKKRKPTSEKQIGQVAKFKDAAHYGKRQMLKPEVKAMYQTGVNRKKRSAYLVATSDFMKAPIINLVDTTAYSGIVGSQILIRAEDDFKVESVSVVISDAAGNTIESGAAVINPEVRDGWIFTSTILNQQLAGSSVTVSATDVAGNVTKKIIQL